MGGIKGWVRLSAATAAGVFVLAVAVPGALAAPQGRTGPAAAAEVHAPVPKLVWRACHHGFQCATARVPLDYRHPYGRTITLALIRLRATDPARRIGSLFVNPGGPGGSGVQEVLTDAPLFAPSVRARFDIVGMDPRGVGGSAPVRCFATNAAQERVIGTIRKAPADRAQYRRDVRLARVLAARCAARNGALLDHLSTANVARDMDLVRQAVGDKKLSYYGISYGTYLGATYAAMFPGRVRAMVLDGNLDPPAYRAGPMPSTPFIRAFGNVGAYDTLQEFFRLCARAGPRCAFSAGGTPAAKFATLVARVTAHPVRLPDGTVVDRGELFFLTFATLGAASDWPGLAKMLQQLYTASRPRQAAAPAPAAAPYNNTLDAQTAILCGETANPHQPTAYPRIAAAADRRTPYAGSYVTWISFRCVFWRAQDPDRYTGSFHVRPASPVLVINNRYDPITPLRNAVTMSHLLAGSRLLVINGWGHTAFLQHNRCAERAAARYLISLKLPPPGATCGGGTPPFAPPHPG